MNIPANDAPAEQAHAVAPPTKTDDQILLDALDITPTNDNNPFVAPPSSDTVIEYVNTLGYPTSLEEKRKLVQETPNETSPAKRSKGGLVRNIRKPMSSLKLVDEPSAEDVPVEQPAYNEEEANLQRALELRLKDQVERTQGPARPVVIREPDSRISRFQRYKEKEKRRSLRNKLLTIYSPFRL
nr:hypothetical protein [Tanacetum cinerariifolium]